MVLSKLALLGTIPFLWAYRVPILLSILVIASVGSHMPSRFRYDSFVHRRVLDHRPPRRPVSDEPALRDLTDGPGVPSEVERTGGAA
jgi:hypothetical protein